MLAVLFISSAAAFTGSWRSLSTLNLPLRQEKSRAPALHAASGDDSVNDRLRNAYKKWCETHSFEFHESRLDIFSYHYLLAEKHSKDTGSGLTLNEYADLTTQEFRRLKETGATIHDIRQEKLSDKDRQESGMPPEIWKNTQEAAEPTISVANESKESDAIEPESSAQTPDVAVSSDVDSATSRAPVPSDTNTQFGSSPSPIPVQSLTGSNIRATDAASASRVQFGSFGSSPGQTAVPLGSVPMQPGNPATRAPINEPRAVSNDHPSTNQGPPSSGGIRGLSSLFSRDNPAKGQFDSKWKNINSSVQNASNSYDARSPSPSTNAARGLQHNSGVQKASHTQGTSSPMQPRKPDTTFEYFAKEKASNLGLDIRTILGSGPGGRVTIADVDAAAAPILLLRHEQTQNKAALDQTVASLEHAKREIEQLTHGKESSNERISHLEKLLAENERDMRTKEQSFASRMAEIVTEKSGIESKKMAAEQQLKLLQSQITQLSSEKQGIEVSKSEFEKQLADTEHKMRLLEADRDSSLKHIEDIERLLENAGVKPAELANKMDSLAASQGSADARLKEIGNSIVRLQSQRDSALSKISDLEQLLAEATKKMQAERESFLAQIAALEKQKAAVNERLQEVQNTVTALSNEKDAVARKLLEAQTTVETVEAKLKDAGSQIENLRYEKNAIEVQHSGAQTVKAETELRLKETENRANVLSAENANLKSQFDAQSTSLKDEIRALQGKLQSIEITKRDIEANLQNAQRSISTLQAQGRSSNEEIAILKREKSEAQGRLRDVQFESQSQRGHLQVEMGALELKLKNITSAKLDVDTRLQEAQRVISSLEAGQKATAGVVANLQREKLEVDGHLKDAKNEVQAIRSNLQQEIAALSSKVATIESSKMDVETRLKDAQQIISSLESQVKASAQSISALETERSEVQGHLRDSQNEIQNIKSKLQEEIYGLQKKVEFIESSKVEVEARLKGAQGVIATLESQAKSSSESLSLNQLKTSEMERKLKDAQDRIKTVTNELQAEIRDLKTKLESISSSKADVQKQLEETQAEIATLRADESSSKRSLATMTHEKSEAESRLRDSQNEAQSMKTQLLGEINLLRRKLDTVESAKVDLETLLQETQEKLSASLEKQASLIGSQGSNDAGKMSDFAKNNLMEKIKELSETIEELRTEKVAALEQLREARFATANVEGKLAKATKDVQALEKEKEALTTQVSGLEEANSESEDRLEASAAQVAQLMKQRELLETKMELIETKHTANTDSAEQIKSLLDEKTGFLAQIAGLQSSQAHLADQLKDAEKTIMELRGKDESTNVADTVPSETESPLSPSNHQASSSQPPSESESEPVISDATTDKNVTNMVPDIDIPDEEVSDALPDVEFRFVDMPGLSPSMKDGTVVSWLKNEGDAVAAGEAIMVVKSETGDKDVIGIGEDGFLAAIIVAAGGSCEVGTPIALIAADEVDIPTLKEYASSLPSLFVNYDESASSATVPFFLSAPFNEDSEDVQTPPIVTSIDDSEQAAVSDSSVEGTDDEESVTISESALESTDDEQSELSDIESSNSGRSSPGYVPFTATPEYAEKLKSEGGDLTVAEANEGSGEDASIDEDQDESDLGPPEKLAPVNETSFNDDFLAVYGSGKDAPERKSLGRIVKTVGPPEGMKIKRPAFTQAAIPIEAVVPDGDEKSPGMVPFTMTPALAKGAAPRSRYVGVPRAATGGVNQPPRRNVRAGWDGSRVELSNNKKSGEGGSYSSGDRTAEEYLESVDIDGVDAAIYRPPVPEPPEELTKLKKKGQFNSPPPGKVSLINRLFGN